MTVCFHCELLTNKSNRSVVKRFTNKLADVNNQFGNDQGKYYDEQVDKKDEPGSNVIENESDSDEE